MDVIAKTAPFLTAYGPVFVGVLIGYITAVAIYKMRTFSPWITRITDTISGTLSNYARRQENPKPREETVLTDVSSQTSDVSPEYFCQEEEEEYSAKTVHVPYDSFIYATDVMVHRSKAFYEEMNKRRSVRMFEDKDFPIEVIHNIIKTAGTSPSGGHKEPWTFVVVSNEAIKFEIRAIIEEEERINYERRMNDTWIKDCNEILDLEKMKLSWQKRYLDEAPYLIIVFKQSYGLTSSGHKIPHYYTDVSVSISVGLLIAAVQNAGLVTVTTTPMNAGPKLRQLLCRPMNEKVVLLLPIGFPAEGATVPVLKRKPLEELMVHMN